MEENEEKERNHPESEGEVTEEIIHELLGETRYRFTMS
jgi:hypothetical protein